MKTLNRLYPGITMVGLFCLLVVAGLFYSSQQPPAAAQSSARASFDFDRFTKNKPFKLNTLPTTSYGPPWADILLQSSNFLECSGAAIALCYYSGPGPTTPCVPDGLGIANCTCYQIPAGQKYLVDINAILNRNVYLKTVAVCGTDGSLCRPTGSRPAPVCEAINNNTLIPGADLVSAFSFYLEKQALTDKEKGFFIKPTTCPTSSYAGCMTAPCKQTGKTDSTTGLPLVQCGCPDVHRALSSRDSDPAGPMRARWQLRLVRRVYAAVTDTNTDTGKLVNIRRTTLFEPCSAKKSCNSFS